MNLIQLRYAKAVADTGSFTKASEKCYVTQPTLSNGIAQLEQELEERLFTRTTRNVSLTQFGKHILPFIDQVLKAHDALVLETRNFVHSSRTVIRIGISPLIHANWLASMVEKFRASRPDAELILHEQNMADLYSMLDEGLLDFVFGVAVTPKSSCLSTFLYREPLYFIPKGNSDIEREKVSFDDIAKEIFVMVPDVCGLARATRALFRKNRRKLTEYKGEALSYQVLEEWAALGLGAAILPQSKLQSGRRAYLLTSNRDKELHLDFEAVWLNQVQPKHLKEFADFLVKHGNSSPS